MSWYQFCENNNVSKIYLDCEIDQLTTLKNSLSNNFFKIASNFLRNPTSLLLQGDPGRGKTHFMYCLVNGLFKINKAHISKVKFICADELDEKVSECIKKFGSSEYLISGICDHEFLFIDDFGVEGSRERAERNYYKILEKRLANEMPTVMSTNLSDQEMFDVFGSRINSRLKQCVKLVFDGEDLRKPKGVL